MPVNPVAENVFGTIGTICWCIQLIPQVWKSWRDKSTYGLSPFMVLTWAASALPLGVYNIVLNTNIPLILQPQLFGTLAAVCWVQCLYYDRHLSLRKAIFAFFAFLAVVGGLQVAFVFAVRHGLDEGNGRPLQFFGVMTVVLIFGGLLPQFYEIWKLKEVLGISMAFMVIDGLGGVFSTLSLAFKDSIDPLLAFSYISVIVRILCIDQP
ncbi:PQ-loop-domain-containing protein [Calocera viscosa TUFC12733]|uniref:PQ-loop-domain-containing protein n=1 Tax=Calocera viscosa (strain TUFC12733) TaxID=1330018 RepID=A0A167S4W9_CALVF|nr:PQ-loop-domain-containing protein [Calocera viscosa TUFC12733]